MHGGIAHSVVIEQLTFKSLIKNREIQLYCVDAFI